MPTIKRRVRVLLYAIYAVICVCPNMSCASVHSRDWSVTKRTMTDEAVLVQPERGICVDCGSQMVKRMLPKCVRYGARASA
jgi:hypothetical protein